ncbi:LysR family transcriptional regulator [Sphingomonas cavernae]|uniref:LysR family transcriptional regulator n=1 Tax=Sphingomonas cavernae TaxID=2320861 RepID=A0A418WUM9_9SPHN|nr:LysR family transcriptional regulator [Sphingomonas cavernae]RJF96392.1 LysR family transcriptional regulator [Sphingomonas cavernae]
MAASERSTQVVENRLLARLKLRQLKLLIAVGEQRNILRAATLLNVAQPAATKMIRDLEATLDMQLFERSSRGVTPTLYGDVIIRHAKLILSQVRHASEELLSLREGTTGKIAVGTLLAAAPSLLPRSIVALKRERPGITVSLVEGTNDKLMPMLRVGDLDLVVGRLPEFREREGLVQEVLYEEPVSIVVRKGHPLAELSVVKLADLQAQEWIMPPPETSLRRQLEQSFRKAKLELPVRAVESVSILANYTILRETDMVAAVPYQVADAQPDLVRLPVNFDIGYGPIGVTLRSGGDTSPATNYFLAMLRRVAAESVADLEAAK